MKALLGILVISFTVIVPAHSLEQQVSRIRCTGFAIEEGIQRAVSVAEEFRPFAKNQRLAELTLNFRFSENNRLNLQVRAMEELNNLKVAATFLEVATAPLGRVESVFFENVFATDTEKVYRIEKEFKQLQIRLSCRK